MSKLISVHEYVLNKNITDEQFEETVKNAKSRGLFNLLGLIDFQFLKRIRGTRKLQYTAIWIYKNGDAWEKLWGRAENPIKKEDYREPWKIWETEILAPLLEQDPDQIYYACYEELCQKYNPTIF